MKVAEFKRYAQCTQWNAGGISVAVLPDAIHLASRTPCRTVSSGIHGGGFRTVRNIFNVMVDRHYSCADPKADLKRRIHGYGVSPNDSVALMTAVVLEDAAFYTAEADGWEILTCVTAGFANAARVTDVLDGALP